MTNKSLKSAYNNKNKHVADNVNITPAINIPIIGNAEDKARVTSLINRLYKSEMGKEMLEEAKNAGYKIVLEASEAYGECIKDLSIIKLNKHLNNDLLVSILSHELAHAGQFARGFDEDIGVECFKDETLKLRTLEADADAKSVLALWQLSTKGDTGPLKEKYQDDKHIIKPFLKKIKKNGKDKNNVAEAMFCSFNAWFTKPQIKQVYENIYLSFYKHLAKNGQDQYTLHNQNIDFNEHISKLCLTKTVGKSYFQGNPSEVLKAPIYTDLSKASSDYIDSFFANREDKYGIEPDKSIGEVVIRNNDYSKLELFSLEKEHIDVIDNQVERMKKLEVIQKRVNNHKNALTKAFNKNHNSR